MSALDLGALMDEARNRADKTEDKEFVKKPRRGPAFKVPDEEGGELLPPLISRRAPGTDATIMMIGAYRHADGKFDMIVKYNGKKKDSGFKYYIAQPTELRTAYANIEDLVKRRKDLGLAFKAANNTHPIEMSYKSKNAKSPKIWKLPPLPEDVYERVLEAIQKRKREQPASPPKQKAKKRQKTSKVAPPPPPKEAEPSSTSSSSSSDATTRSSYQPGSDLVFAKMHSRWTQSSAGGFSESDSGGLSITDSDDDQQATSDHYNPETSAWIRHARDLLRKTRITDNVMTNVGPTNIDIFVRNVQARSDVPLGDLFTRLTLTQLVYVQRFNHIAEKVPGLAEALCEAEGCTFSDAAVGMARKLFVTAIDDIVTTFMFGEHTNPDVNINILKPMFRGIYQRLEGAPAEETPFFDLVKRDDSIQLCDTVTIIRAHIKKKIANKRKLQPFAEVFLVVYLFGMAVGFSAIPGKIICEQFSPAFKL